MNEPEIAVVIPTRNRARYLDVALASLEHQRAAVPHELLVVDDCSTDATAEVLAAHGVPHVSQAQPLGLNAARNAGVRATTAPIVAFVDDDVWIPPGWLEALAEGARRHPQAEAFGGPIVARLEGPTPGGCGREKPPITTLDLGPDDVPATMVWGANMAVRRPAFERVGAFDETIGGHGDEEDWLRRLRQAGGSIEYLAAAGLEHRRADGDARLLPLTRAAYHRGRAARRSDERRRLAPAIGSELRTLGGCLWHTVRRGCPQGLIMGAHAVGRLRQAAAPGATYGGGR